jgi:hypothetical protein
MRITCLDASIPGVPTTVKNLGMDLGAYIHVGTVGELRTDGRRKADQAPHTANVGVMSQHVQRVRKNHALRTHRFELSLQRAQDPENTHWVRERCAEDAKLIEAQQAHELKHAIDHIKVASADCTIDANTVPWLLAYSKMLDEDESTGMEFESNSYEEEEVDDA